MKKYRVHSMEGIILLIPTNSLSVDLRIFSFCLVEETMGNPQPRVNPPPVWPRIFGCIANDASTYHSSQPFCDPRVHFISDVARRYSIKCHSFLQSSMSGDLTRVVRNAIAVDVSGRARFVAYSVLATML